MSPITPTPARTIQRLISVPTALSDAEIGADSVATGAAFGVAAGWVERAAARVQAPTEQGQARAEIHADRLRQDLICVTCQV